MTNHDAFTYFVDAYDLTFVGSVIPSFDDNAEPSAAEIDDLVAKIRATGVRGRVLRGVDLAEGGRDDRAGRRASPCTRATTRSTATRSAPTGTPGETYLGSQVHNATLILESWGVTPSPLPRAPARMTA